MREQEDSGGICLQGGNEKSSSSVLLQVLQFGDIFVISFYVELLFTAAK